MVPIKDETPPLGFMPMCCLRSGLQCLRYDLSCSGHYVSRKKSRGLQGHIQRHLSRSLRRLSRPYRGAF